MSLKNRSTRFQVLLTLAIVSFITTTAVAILLAIQEREAYFNQYAVSLSATSQEIETRLINIDQKLRSDVMYLARTPPISGIVRAMQNDGIDPEDNSTLESQVEQLQLFFSAFATANPAYHKIRFIGAADAGRELVRVDLTDLGLVSTSPENLQREGDRFYFTESQTLEAGDVRLSPINLNQENGSIEVPQRPVWRAATSVFTQTGELFGIVMINFDMGAVFADITESVRLQTGMDDIQTFMTNSDGEYLLHPDPERGFGFEYGESDKFEDEFYNIATVVGPRDDERLTSVDVGRNLLSADTVENADASLYLHRRAIDVNPGAGGQTLTVWIALAQSLVDSPALVATARFWVAGILIGIILLMVLGWNLARQLAPLSALSVAAQKMAEGDYQIDLPDANNLETANLTNSLSLLGEKVAQREGELRKNHNSLEETVALRTEELENSRDEAKRLVRVKSDFLANMSHEIRTPMTAVLGLLDILRHTEMSTQQQQYVFQIHNSSRALLYIIDDILDISKIDAGKLTIEKVDFSLLAVIESAIDLFSPSAELKSVNLHLNMDPRTAIIAIGDRTRLTQVLNNLLGNAIKFTQEGSVILATEIQEEQDTSITIRFSVSDTGIGIKEDAMTGLFEAFEQADTTTTRLYGGSGLGLSISYKLVGLMGGELQASSVPDEGSTFWFDLTFGRSENEEPSLSGVGVLDKRVLVVDDQPISCRILSSMFSHWGCVVDCAHNGVEALEKIATAANENESYNLLLVDWRMPDMDGLTLLTKIQSLNESHKLNGAAQVLMINEAGRSELEQSANNVDDIKLLHKPITISRLLNTLAELGFIKLIKEDSLEVEREGVEASLRAKLDAMSSPAKLLLVEDNATNQMVVQELLSGYRLEIAIANNGAEAVEIVSHEAIDLVLMDLQMPVMDGFEATKKIREFKPLNEFPILALSAATFTEDIRQSSHAGMNDHLQKPIDVLLLLSALLKWLPLDSAPKLQQSESETAATSDIDGEESSATAEEDVLAMLKNDSGFDLSDTILSYAGAPALIRIIQAFCTEFNEVHEVWESDVEWDHAEKRRVAHSLKGAAANVGAVVLVELAAKTESAIIGGDETLLDELMLKLKEVLVKLEVVA